MTEELSSREIIKIQSNATRHMRNALMDIRTEAQDAMRFATKSGFKPNRSIERIHHIAAQELAWLDIQGAKVDELKSERARNVSDILHYDGGSKK